jgi:hypothetical protein
MKKSIFTLAVFILLSTISFLQAQNLSEILDKHYKAVGQDKLNNTETYTVKAKVSQMDMDISIIMKMKKPNKFRMDADVMGQQMVQAYDGQKGWMIAPWISNDPQELAGAELQQAMDQTDMEGELYNYAQKGHKVELVGKENVDGKETFNLKVTSKNGSVKNYFIDAGSYLISQVKAKVIQMGEEMNVTQKSTEYKDFNGVKVATKIISETPMGNSEVIIEEVKFGEPVDDSIFVRPSK